MSLLEKLSRHVEKQGKLKPTYSADVNPRYIHAARELAKEKTGSYEEFDSRLEKLVINGENFAKNLPRTVKAGIDEFCDEFVMDAACEIARDMRQEDEETFYKKVGRRMVEEGSKEKSPLFKIGEHMPMRNIYIATALFNKNFNAVTDMTAYDEPLFDILKSLTNGGRRRIRKLGQAVLDLTRKNKHKPNRTRVGWQTKKEQMRRYQTFYEEKAKQKIKNNIYITLGVLEAGPQVKDMDNATVIYYQEDNGCKFDVLWGSEDEVRTSVLEIELAEMKELLSTTEAQKAEYAKTIRQQERKGREMLEAQALIGRIAQGYVHDLANKNTRLSMFLQTEQMYHQIKKEEEAKEYRRQADEELQSIQDIMRDFQDFTINKRLRYNRQPTTMAQVVDKYVNRMQKAAEKKGIEIICECAYQGAVSVDLYKFPRITENIIGNAIKVLEEGGKVIVRTYEQEDKAVIEYEDNGPGIPPEIQERLFEPNVSGTGSTGLGMEIVKMFVEAHEGTIDYQTGTAGTKFTIKIPQYKNTHNERTDQPTT